LIFSHVQVERQLEMTQKSMQAMKFELSNESIKSRSAIQQVAQRELELGAQCEMLTSQITELKASLRDAEVKRDSFVA
jgi:hypothetical protein